MFLRQTLLGLLFISNVFGQSPYSKKYPPSTKRRAIVLKVISSGKASGNVEWNEDTLAEAIYWFGKGDHDALSSILDSGDHCDGAISEEFGSWLGETFLARPKEILKAVSARPVPKQKQLGLYAVAADGGGHGPKKMLQIRKLLIRYSRSNEPDIASTAGRWLKVLGQFESDQRDQQ